LSLLVWESACISRVRPVAVIIFGAYRRRR
jgi:hypothetical protein